MMEPPNQEWHAMKVRSGHGKNRSIQDALMELHMNGLDHHKKVVHAVGAAKITTEDGKVIVVSNASPERFKPDNLYVGRPEDGGDDPTAMGQYGLGLKDALAVLLRNNCKVRLTSHGQRIEFEKTKAGGLVPGFEESGPIKIDGMLHEQAGMLCYRSAGADAAENTSTWVYTIDVTTTLKPEEGKGIVCAVQKYFAPPDPTGLIYQDDSVAIFEPNININKGAKGNPRFGLGDHPNNTGGVYVGDRFVELPGGGSWTFFGYHFKKQTKEMRDGISRDQKLTLSITDQKSPCRELLMNLWNSQQAWETLRKHVPEQPSFELNTLQHHVPALKEHYKRKLVAAAPNVGVRVHPPHATRTPPAAAPPSPARPGPIAFAGPVEQWLKKQADLARHLDPTRLTTLQKLNNIVQETFPTDYAQLVPYGSTIYEVCAPGSDIDATLMVQSTAVPEQTAEERLAALSDRLKAAKLNVEPKLKAAHPVLVVHKHETEGICFDVDVSFAGHSEIHKSHEVKRLLLSADPKGRSAFKLALVVKVWAAKWNMKSKNGFLSSHAWMLLVILYTRTPPDTANASALGFFEWFIDKYPRREEWEIGSGTPPLEFEKENAAAWVGVDKRSKIADAASSARDNLSKHELPWADATRYPPA